MSTLPIGAMSDSAPCAAGTAHALFSHNLGYARRCAVQMADSGCCCATNPVDGPVLSARLQTHLRYDNMIPDNFVDEVIGLIRLQIVATVRCHTRTRRSNCMCAGPPSADSPCPKWLARLESSLGTARAALLTPSKPRRRRTKSLSAGDDAASIVVFGGPAAPSSDDPGADAAHLSFPSLEGSGADVADTAKTLTTVYGGPAAALPSAPPPVVAASPSSVQSWADSVDADPAIVAAQLSVLGAAFDATVSSAEASSLAEQQHMSPSAPRTPHRSDVTLPAPCASPALLSRTTPDAATTSCTLMDKSILPPGFAAIERCGRRDA